MTAKEATELKARIENFEKMEERRAFLASAIARLEKDCPNNLGERKKVESFARTEGGPHVSLWNLEITDYDLGTAILPILRKRLKDVQEQIEKI